MSDFGVKTVSILNPINLSIGTMNGVAIVAGGSTYSSGSLGLVAGANITLSTGASNVTIIGGAGAGGGAALQGSGTYTQNSGTIQFANSNNFTFGLTANQMTASFSDSKIQYTSNTSNITTGAFPNANTTKFAGSGFTGTNATGTLNSNGLALSVANPGGGGNTVTVSGSNGTIQSNGLSFVGSNGINVYTTAGNSIIISGPTVGGAQTGISTIAGGGTTYTAGAVTITGSGNVSITNSNGSLVISGSTQSVQPAVAQLNGSSGTMSLAVGSNLTSSTNGSTITFGVVTNYSTNWSNALTTAAQSNQVVNSLNGSTGQISLVTGSSLSASSNGSTITFGLASNISTAWSGQTTANSSQVLAVNGSSGQISFATGSNITSSSNGSTITWGLVTNYSTNWTNITSNAFNTSGSSNFVLTANSTKFVSVGQVSTVATAGSTMSGSANSAGITLAVPAWLTAAAGGGIALSGGGSNFTSGTVSMGNTAGISWFTTNGSLCASITDPYDHDDFDGWQLIGNNTAGTTGTTNTSALTVPLYLSGGANITLSGNSNTICIVGGGGGGAQSWSAAGNTQATMNTTATGNQMYLSGAANITVGMSNNSILISGNNPGAAAENNWMTLLGANVSSNSSASGSTIGWSGSNITLAGTNNSQIIISAPATSSIVGVNGISVATNASTISISGLLPTLQHYSNGNGGFTALSIVGQGSMSVVHDYVPFYVTGTAANIGLIVSLPAVNSTGSANISLGMGIYTLNGSTLSLASSGSANNAFTWSSNSQNPGVTGARLFSVPMNINMTPGQYWMAAWLSTATTNTGATVSMMGKGQIYSSGAFAALGSNTTVNRGPAFFQGVYTAATSGALPSVISTAHLTYAGTAQSRANIWYAISNANYFQ